MKKNIKEVENIPESTSGQQVFSIKDNGKREYTHGIFKYPCKFIPKVPRWFLKKYSSEKTSKHGVLDPFVGSGTTLVESSILNFPSYGIDFDPLSHLLTKTKSVEFSGFELEKIEEIVNLIEDRLFSYNHAGSTLKKFIPDYSKLNHWFSEKAIFDLASIKYLIDYYTENRIEEKGSAREKIKNYLLINFASVIRRSSKADNSSPKPYIPGNIEIDEKDARKLFINSARKNIEGFRRFSSEVESNSGAEMIGDDARNVDLKGKKGIHLAVTSPPYINAFNYVRSLKLENIWLDFVDHDQLQKLHKKQIGTERIPASVYNEKVPSTGLKNLDSKLHNIYQEDPRRSHTVSKFFDAMEDNLQEIRRSLVPGGYYCLVVGRNKIRGEQINTPEILKKLAAEIGYEVVEEISYVIQDRYLNMPRKGRGGKIEEDMIVVLKSKENGKK